MHPWLRLNEALLAALSETRLRRRRDMAGRRRALGEGGERSAYFHLRRLGYQIVARQWRAPNLSGEIDLIAWEGETLCFVEVKARSERDRYAPERLLHENKRAALRTAARAYARGLFDEGDPEPEMRVDVVTVLRSRGRWYPELERDAFSLRTWA